MKCEEVQERMIDYLDKTIDEVKFKEIGRHLETCERCLDEVRDLQQAMQVISKDEMELPDDTLKINFYHMLHNEIKTIERKSAVNFQNIGNEWYSLNRYRVAAAIALLICGTFLGILIKSQFLDSYSSSELKQLHSEVLDLKKSAMFAMLKEESSSDRIQAVNYVEGLENPDENIIEALVKTLNNDKNLNVRMAAAYALSKFADQRAVCDSLVKSLSIQSDPILQVTLINILVERKEKSALRPIQQIIGNKRTLKEVRAVAENSLRVLM